jgi:DNA-binding LytR/AlgR family response regulator
MNKMRVLIVEDRPFARARLNYLLTKKHPDVEVVDAFEDTASAWAQIEAGDIDGVFIDIHIETEGRRAGLELANLIDRLPDQKPWVVFTTGFEEHALAAYKAHPFDYIVKPLTDKKIAEVVDRLRKERQKKTSVSVSVGNEDNQKTIEIKHRTVDRGETILCTKYIAQKDIIYVQSNNEGNTTKKELLNKTKAQLVNSECIDGIIDKSLENWLNETSKLWMDENGEPVIVRIYTSYLVNLNHVNGYKPDPQKEGGYLVTFRDCKDELPIGRTYFNDLRDALKRRGSK